MSNPKLNRPKLRGWDKGITTALHLLRIGNCAELSAESYFAEIDQAWRDIIARGNLPKTLTAPEIATFKSAFHDAAAAVYEHRHRTTSTRDSYALLLYDITTGEILAEPET